MPSSLHRSACAAARGAPLPPALAMTFSLCRQRLSRRPKPHAGAMSSNLSIVSRSCRGSPTFRPRPGMPAPIPIRPCSIHSSPMASSRRWRMPARVGGRSGWTPRHLVLKDAAQAIVGCAPCYLKSHSQGEYVFDRSWADAYERAGGRYYPKLQIAVPFTPVPGRRLLVRPGPDAEAERGAAGRRRAVAAGRAQRPVGAAHHASSARANGSGSASAASSSAPTSSSTGAMPATAPSTTSWPRSPRASARPCARSARRRVATGLDHRVGARPRHHGGALGRLLRLLHGHGLAQVGAALSQPQGVLADRRGDGRELPADHGQAGQAADRRLAAHDRRRLPLRPLLGRDRAPPLPALRAVLLPGHRVRHRRTRLRAWRRARRASTSWRAAICRP